MFQGPIHRCVEVAVCRAIVEPKPGRAASVAAHTADAHGEPTAQRISWVQELRLRKRKVDRAQNSVVKTAPCRYAVELTGADNRTVQEHFAQQIKFRTHVVAGLEPNPRLCRTKRGQ